MKVTFGEMLDRGLWDKFCSITGVSLWAVNEGLASRKSEYELDEDEARQLLGCWQCADTGFVMPEGMPRACPLCSPKNTENGLEEQ